MQYDRRARHKRQHMAALDDERDSKAAMILLQRRDITK